MDLAPTAHSRAPVRISLAGGGTDVAPYPEQHGGAVVSLAVTLHACAELRLTASPEFVVRSRDAGETVRARRLDALVPDGRLDVPKAVARALFRGPGGFELTVAASVPPRSGLGGSAALFVATIAVFDALAPSGPRGRRELAELAWRLENDELHNLGGRQDPYAAAFGGLNFLEFRGHGDVRVAPLTVPGAVVAALERGLLLFSLGARPAPSGRLIERQAARVATGANLAALHRTRALALETRAALLRGDLDEVGRILHRAWQEKKRFAEGISDERIDAHYDALRVAGALGGKVTGAGGGGHLAVYAPPTHRAAVLRAAADRGLACTPYAVDREGVRAWTGPAVPRRACDPI